jgi:hypothetical protein
MHTPMNNTIIVNNATLVMVLGFSISVTKKMTHKGPFLIQDARSI